MSKAPPRSLVEKQEERSVGLRKAISRSFGNVSLRLTVQSGITLAAFWTLLLWLTFDYYSLSGTLAYFAIAVGTLPMGVLIWRFGMVESNSHERVLQTLGIVSLVSGVVGFLVVLSTASAARYEEIADGLWYRRMGQGFVANGEFIVDGSPTRHYPPLYPLILAGVYSVSDSVSATQAVSAFLYFISLAVTFETTRRLYSRGAALLTSGIVSTVPMFPFYTALNSSEHLVLMIYAATIFCIYKSTGTDCRHYIVYAGILAGLGYLSKSSIGYFFVLAGILGLGWRLYHKRRAVLHDRYYLVAILIFAGIVSTWALRNLRLFWDGSSSGFFEAWQTSYYFVKASSYVFEYELLNYLREAMLLMLFGVLFLSLYIWAWLPELRRSLSFLGEEKMSFLWISFVVPIVLAILITPVFYVYEAHSIPQWVKYTFENRISYFALVFGRYAFISLVPAAWIVWEIRTRSAPPSKSPDGDGEGSGKATGRVGEASRESTGSAVESDFPGPSSAPKPA